jgi:Lon protease-like protein
MSERLPLFPLGTVLFPGLVLPLHVFEERYRALVRHLIRDDDDHGAFGVVAIRRGKETVDGDTAVDGTPTEHAEVTLHQVGCTAEIRQLTAHPDGRFDLVTVGRRRFRIRELHRGAEPFLSADVDWVDEPDADSRAELLVPGLLDLFQRYLQVIRTDGGGGEEQLPDDPAVLSYLIAATTVLAIDDRQQLLAAATPADRLALERRLINRELVLLRELNALPIPLGDLAAASSEN